MQSGLLRLTSAIRSKTTARSFRTTPAWIVLFSLSLGVDHVRAQRPPGEASSRSEQSAAEHPIGGYSDQVSIEWVSVAVEATSPAGPHLRYEAEDFVVTVDDRRVAIADFEGSGGPVGVLFLQDLSGSMGLGGRLAGSVELYLGLLKRLGPSDELSLVSFADGEVETHLVFDADVGLRKSAFKDWEAFGKTALHDAVARVPELARASRRSKRGAVLVTDGTDNASVLTAEQARAALATGSVPLFILELAPRAGAESAKTTEVLTTLAGLAQASGGALYSSEPYFAARLSDGLLNRLRNQYRISFPTDPETPKKARRIEVTVTNSDVLVSHRTHYYGSAPMSHRLDEVLPALSARSSP